MRRPIGQALRVVRRLTAVILAVGLLGCVALGGLAWRLSEGPIEVPELAARIADALNTPDAPGRITVGAAKLSWDGWREGLSPFEIRLQHVQVLDEAGRVQLDLPDALVSLSYRWLLVGRIAPRRIELASIALRARRDAEGRFQFAFAPQATETETAPDDGSLVLDRALADLTSGQADASPLGALERVTVRDARITVRDDQLGADWALEHATLELRRIPRNGMEFDGRVTLRLGEEEVPARVHGTLAGNPTRVEGTLTLLQIRPALLARQSAVLAPLAALDATASLEVRLGARIDGGGASMAAVLHVGPGMVALGQGGQVAFASADISAVATPQAMRLERAVLRLAPSHGAAATWREGPVLSLAGEAQRQDGEWTAALRAHIDRVPMPDLADHWPLGIVPGARSWLTENVTTGVARNGSFSLRATIPAAFDDLRITDFTGTLEAEDLTVHWLRPVPPMERVRGTAEFGMNEIVVRVQSGRQQGSGVQARESVLRFGNFNNGPGDADLDIRMAGPVADVMAVVRHPRLHIFDGGRIVVPDLAGHAQDIRLRIGFPLIASLEIEDLRMQAEARVTDLRVSRAVMGRDLERGTADVSVTMEGLRVHGQAVLTDIPVRVGVEMDFRAGPPGQVLSRETLSARADIRQLVPFGLDVREYAEGTLQLEARNESRRGQASRLTLRGDLRETRLKVDLLRWQKPRGAAGSLDAVLRIQGDQVLALEQLRIEAPDGLLRARGNAFRSNGWPERLELQEVVVGGSRFSGEARPARTAGGEWQISLRGPVLDLTRAMAEQGDDGAPQPAAPPTSTTYAVDWRFDRVILGAGRVTGAATGRALVDAAGVLRRGEAEARFGNAGATLRITPEGARRRVSIASTDGGALLRLLDVTSAIQGGRLTVEGVYEHGRAGAPLAGQAELTDFSVRNAPGFAKLMQAMTLYGLVEAMSGPGLGFIRLVAPFRMTPDTLELEDARAFSASLGVTGRGRLDRRRSLVDMDGTIVPAYFFNQILGNIPILGRLFSPEAGGGLFAATYRLRGPMADPNVTVNPLAALTPGFLRGIFQLGPDGQPRTMSPEVRQQGLRSRVPAPTSAPAITAPAEVPLRGPPPN